MATRRVEIGSTGEVVRANVARIRKRQGLTLRDVSDRLAENGWPMAHNTVSEVERGARRVDVDDLVALAAALEVSPSTLLLPADVDPSTLVTVNGFKGEVTAQQFWDWLTASYPLQGPVMAFFGDALPSWERIGMESRLGAAIAGLMELRAPRGTHGDD